MRTSGNGPSAEAILEARTEPLFGVDAAGRISVANSAFRAIVGDLDSLDAYETFGLDASGGVATWTSADGRTWAVSLVPVEGGCAGRLRPLVPEGPDRFSEIARELVRAFTLPKREEELIRALAGAVEHLLPDRLVCVRLFDPSTGQLDAVFATGQLLEGEREVVTISRRALEVFGGPPGVAEDGVIEVRERYVPIFERATDGFDVPLHDGETIYGVLSIDSSTPPAMREGDATTVRYLAFAFVTALGSARKLGDSIYSRDFFVKLLDNANAPILVTDRARRIKLINRAFEKLTGYDRFDVLDRDVKDYLAPKERERFLPAVVAAIRGRATGTLEVRIPHSDGQSVAHIALSLAAVKSGYGEIEGVVAVGQDLTELRRLQQQVIHSEKLATLGQLAAGVVHELNNPLTSISVYSEYLLKKLERENGDPGDIAKLQRICEGAERILKFSRDLVAYARPAGEEPRLVDLREVVEQALVFCEHVIARAGVAVERSYEENLPRVYGVKGQLQQILVNLITNACDAMSSGEGRLSIALSSVEDRVRLVVADSGSGIPKEDRERVFEPFFSTKPEGRGTGLGLSIVRNIITNHDGTVYVEDGDEGGASFVIELFSGD